MVTRVKINQAMTVKSYTKSVWFNGRALPCGGSDGGSIPPIDIDNPIHRMALGLLNRDSRFDSCMGYGCLQQNFT